MQLCHFVSGRGRSKPSPTACSAVQFPLHYQFLGAFVTLLLSGSQVSLFPALFSCWFSCVSTWCWNKARASVKVIVRRDVWEGDLEVSWLPCLLTASCMVEIFLFNLQRSCTSPPNLTPAPNLEVIHMVGSIWKSWSQTEMWNSKRSRAVPSLELCKAKFRLM